MCVSVYFCYGLFFSFKSRICFAKKPSLLHVSELGVPGSEASLTPWRAADQPHGFVPRVEPYSQPLKVTHL